MGIYNCEKCGILYQLSSCNKPIMKCWQCENELIRMNAEEEMIYILNKQMEKDFKEIYWEEVDRAYKEYTRKKNAIGRRLLKKVKEIFK